jgi:hypothetical protein
MKFLTFEAEKFLQAKIKTVAEKGTWDSAKRGQRLGLVWKIKRKLSLMTTFTYSSLSYFFYTDVV